MAGWQRTLDLRDVWPTRDVHLIAKTIAERLTALAPIEDEYLDSKRDDIAEEFGFLADDPDSDADSFDWIMRDLYDWADAHLEDKWNGKKMCWVRTIL